MSQNIQSKRGLKTRQLVLRLGVARSTWQRWNGRSQRGEPLLNKPGPKKLGPLPLGQLALEIKNLRHHLKRTSQTGPLYQKYREAISRRDIAQKVVQERKRHMQSRRNHKQHIEWKQPNLAWAIDATEYTRDGTGQKLWVHAVRDLATRYQHEPLTALESRGVAVAAHLEMLFRRHGAPLLIKRDNGGVFNHQAVNEMLARWGVIPLNSPPYYAPYNGAIEQAIRELKKDMVQALPVPQSWDPAQVSLFLAVLTAKANHRSRKCLGGQTAQHLYGQKQRRGCWNQRQRHQAFEWIRSHAKARLENKAKGDQRSTNAAWRHAVEAWLSDQALIAVSIKPKSVTPFCPPSGPINW